MCDLPATNCILPALQWVTDWSSRAARAGLQGVNLGGYCRQRAPGRPTMEPMHLKRSMLRDRFFIGLQGRSKEPGPAWAYVGAWTSDPGLGKTEVRRNKELTRTQVTHHEPSGRKTGQSVSGLSGLIRTTLSLLLSCMLASLAWNPQKTRRTVATGIPIVPCVFP